MNGQINLITVIISFLIPPFIPEWKKKLCLFLNEGRKQPQLHSNSQIHKFICSFSFRLPLWAADRPSISLAQPNEAAAINHSSQFHFNQLSFIIDLPSFVFTHSIHYALWLIGLLFVFSLRSIGAAGAHNPPKNQTTNQPQPTQFRRCKQLTQPSIKSNQISLFSLRKKKSNLIDWFRLLIQLHSFKDWLIGLFSLSLRSIAACRRH